MYIKTFLVALVAAFMGIACSSNGGSKATKIDSGLTNEGDSLAYVVGLNIANQLQKMDSTINYAVVCRAIVEHFEGEALMTDEEAKQSYLRYLLYVEPERRRSYEEQFLADLAANDREYTRTKSGLTYHVDVIGDESMQPRSSNDWVTVKYSISRVGGEKLYPTADADEAQTSVECAVEDLPSGVTESLRLIGKGGKIRAWLPSKLAYGEQGNEEYGVEPVETLFFEIELVDVEKGAAVKKKKELELKNF